MRGPDNGLTKALLIKTLAKEVAKMMASLGEKEFVYAEFYDSGHCIEMSSTMPNPKLKPPVVVTIRIGPSEPINLCNKLLSNKHAETVWPLAKEFHAAAMELAKKKREKASVVTKATQDFINQNERIMVHFK